MFGYVFENAFIHRVVAFGIALNRYEDIFHATILSTAVV